VVLDLSARLLRDAARSKRKRRWVAAALQVAAPVVPVRPAPSKPIFVLGSPRSGTTMLFRLLNQSSNVASLDAEGHLLWEMFHHDRGRDWSFHEVGADSITDRERRVLFWAIDRLTRGSRYLDKDPANCFRIRYLDALFPDARFVFLKRDGRATVSSLLTAWRSDTGAFPGKRLRIPLSIDGYTGTRWRFVVPPGWEAYANGRSLEEVCAFQWTSCMNAILSAREEISDERWIEVSYEQMVEAPREAAARLLSALELPPDPQVEIFADNLDTHLAKALSRPEPDKWRKENLQEVTRALPLIEPVMRRLDDPPSH
jgi:hypothetical protein